MNVFSAPSMGQMTNCAACFALFLSTGRPTAIKLVEVKSKGEEVGDGETFDGVDGVEEDDEGVDKPDVDSFFTATLVGTFNMTLHWRV